MSEQKSSHRIACYDNGGETADRYTVCYLDQPAYGTCLLGAVDCVGMSAEPFHPQGFGQHAIAQIGAHLGKRIDFTELPPDCQRLVLLDLACEPHNIDDVCT